MSRVEKFLAYKNAQQTAGSAVRAWGPELCPMFGRLILEPPKAAVAFRGSTV